MLAKVEIEMKFYSPLNVKISIEDRNGAVVALGSIAEEGTAVLEIASPELWNTENPYLYKLILETENEVIVDHIALRKIEIKDQIIYLNGQKIKFRGVCLLYTSGDRCGSGSVGGKDRKRGRRPDSRRSGGSSVCIAVVFLPEPR